MTISLQGKMLHHLLDLRFPAKMTVIGGVALLAESVINSQTQVSLGDAIGIGSALVGASWLFSRKLSAYEQQAKENHEQLKRLDGIRAEIVTVHERGDKILERLARLETEHEVRCRNYCPKDTQ